MFCEFFLDFLPDVTYFSWKLIPRHLTLLEAEFEDFFSKYFENMEPSPNIGIASLFHKDLLKNDAIFIEVIVSLERI